MANWKSITEALVRTAKNTAILDSVQSLAGSRGEDDPLPAIIAKVIARIRSAVSAGNALDSDTTKIPNSLEGLAVGMITRGLKDYLEIELSSAEQKQADDDRSWLNRIVDEKLQFETPDDSAGSGEMNSSYPSIATVDPDTTKRRTTRGGMAGL